MVCLPVKNILICTWAAILAAKKRGNKEKEKLFCEAKKTHKAYFSCACYSMYNVHTCSTFSVITF